VQVTFREERVIVVHQKTEQAKDDPSHVGDPTFVFQWELQLIFTIDMKKFLDSSFAITNLVFSSKMDGSKYKKFKKLIGDWQETSTVFMQEDRFPRCSPSISRKRSAKKSRSRNPSPKAARKKEIPQKKEKIGSFRKVQSDPLALRQNVERRGTADDAKIRTIVEDAKIIRGTIDDFRGSPKKSPGKKETATKKMV